MAVDNLDFLTSNLCNLFLHQREVVPSSYFTFLYFYKKKVESIFS